MGRVLSTSLPNFSVRWSENEMNSDRKDWPFIIGVAGGTASGKTSVCNLIVNRLGIDNHRVAIISQDCFYKSLTEENHKHVVDYNFDHPDAFDWELIEETLLNLKQGRTVRIPHYDFVTHSRVANEGTTICSIDVILFEGILALWKPSVMQYMNMKIFVDTDADTRLARRIKRDIKERGRDLDGVLIQYQKFVKPAFDEYILPTKRYADVIIPRGADNLVAIDLIVQHLKSKFEKNRELSKAKSKNIPVTNEYLAFRSAHAEDSSYQKNFHYKRSGCESGEAQTENQQYVEKIFVSSEYFTFETDGLDLNG